jgi:endonuclease-3 related protein
MTTGRIAMDPARIRDLHDDLLAHFGPQHWWPGGSPFEVMAGAILVQRTRWNNAAMTLDKLDRAGLLRPARLAACPVEELEGLVRPAGFYRQKARRLRAAGRWWMEQGGRRGSGRQPTSMLRNRLLGLDGIGPETADSILLYVFERPVFIADAYARRLFRRLGWIHPPVDDDYESVARAVNATTRESPAFFNELHALIVAHGKSVCLKSPRCAECPLRHGCDSAGLSGATERRRSAR